MATYIHDGASTNGLGSAATISATARTLTITGSFNSLNGPLVEVVVLQPQSSGDPIAIPFLTVRRPTVIVLDLDAGLQVNAEIKEIGDVDDIVVALGS